MTTTPSKKAGKSPDPIPSLPSPSRPLPPPLSSDFLRRSLQCIEQANSVYQAIEVSHRASSSTQSTSRLESRIQMLRLPVAYFLKIQSEAEIKLATQEHHGVRNLIQSGDTCSVIKSYPKSPTELFHFFDEILQGPYDCEAILDLPTGDSFDFTDQLEKKTFSEAGKTITTSITKREVGTFTSRGLNVKESPFSLDFEKVVFTIQKDLDQPKKVIKISFKYSESPDPLSFEALNQVFLEFKRLVDAESFSSEAQEGFLPITGNPSYTMFMSADPVASSHLVVSYYIYKLKGNELREEIFNQWLIDLCVAMKVACGMEFAGSFEDFLNYHAYASDLRKSRPVIQATPSEPVLSSEWSALTMVCSAAASAATALQRLAATASVR